MQVDITKPVQFTREFTDKDGIKNIWYYDTEKYGFNPYKVEIIDPNDKEVTNEAVVEEAPFDPVANELLPKSKRKYIHPQNNKIIGYTRARALGVID